MAEGNGELVEEMANQKMEGAGDGERTEDYTKLLEYGLDKKVSGRCIRTYRISRIDGNEMISMSMTLKVKLRLLSLSLWTMTKRFAWFILA